MNEAQDNFTLPRRPRESSKRDYGHLLIVGGSVGYTGAPCLCAAAAVRGGAGLVSLGVPRSIYPAAAVKCDEAMPFPLADDADGRLSAAALPVIRAKLERCAALAVGPGLGRGEETGALVRALTRDCPCPLVADADALWALSGDLTALREARAAVLTPHAREFALLGGDPDGDRRKEAAAFAREYGCCLVLKGHETVAAFPDGEIYVNHTGNPGMAKGGTGDVLTGLIGALLCQLPLRRAVKTAVWLHGRAGDRCAEELGEYGMTASDLVRALPLAMKEITEA